MVADSSVRASQSWVTGANETDHHTTDTVLGRDFSPTDWDEIVVVEPGDECPSCGAPLRIDRGIEVGHVFQLGTKYTEALGALYTDDAGSSTRWSWAATASGSAASSPRSPRSTATSRPGVARGARARTTSTSCALGDVAAAADSLYSELQSAGYAVLYDDRDARPGVKFADADLLGVPVQLVVGTKGLARGVVERKMRSTVCATRSSWMASCPRSPRPEVS